MNKEHIEKTYPFASFPEKGIVLYPFRREAPQNVPTQTATFVRQLKQCMPPQIQLLHDACVNVSDHQTPYRLGIALLAEGHSDVRIDVEIDIPYNSTLKPLHFLSCGDGYRDGVLNRHGWIVVRFAAQQVQSEPQACIGYLLRLLKERMPEVSLPELSVDGPQPVSRWTRNEAVKMAACSRFGGGESMQVRTCNALTPDERRCQSLVAPLPRTAEMQQKMATFKDAGHYAQDQYIDFEPEEHIYTYDGRERLLPVSSLIAYFFEDFDALAAATRHEARYHIPVAETLDKWDRIGRIASEVGTFVHEQTENYFRDGTFETSYPFEYEGTVEIISVEREKQHFLRFIEDYKIQPYRQEWPVFDAELNIAGTIDLICQEPDGTFTIYDWKRSSKVVNPSGQPIVDAFGGRMSFNGISLPDTAFYHYCIQQNLYRYMLETHYGIRVKAMNLVVLCPDYPSYYVVSVPKMDKVIEQIVSVCHTKDLGHSLL